MRNDEVAFLTFSQPVPDKVSDMLLVAAYQMTITRQRRLKVKSDDAEGVVTTKFQHISLSGMNGVRFDAKIECSRGTIVMAFLARLTDLDAFERDEFMLKSRSGSDFNKWKNPLWKQVQNN